MPPLSNETRDRIKSLLSDSPLMTARQIARQLEVDRAHVNRILHSSLDHFEKEGPAQWRSRTSDDALATTRRPQGPYGPARNLLPKGQTLHRVDGTATCIEILKKMLDCDFSAVPVCSDGLVIGVATLESIHEHFLTLSGGTVQLSVAFQTPIQSACHIAQFIDPEAFVDQSVDWEDIQYVIVGTATKPLGILTVADVWKRLNSFSEAFVLIHEIETGFRSLIETVARRAQCTLGDWLVQMHVHSGQSTPTALTDMNFSQYLDLVSQSPIYSHFAPILGDKSAFSVSFKRINKIRNEVMHFRVESDSGESLKPLRQFRIAVAGWLRQAT